MPTCRLDYILVNSINFDWFRNVDWLLILILLGGWGAIEVNCWVSCDLQVLSGKLMPTLSDSTTMNSTQLFRQEFLLAGGLNLVCRVLRKDFFPYDVSYEIRQGCCLIALQLARFLLCGEVDSADTVDACSVVKNPTTPSKLQLTPTKIATPTKLATPTKISPVRLQQTTPVKNQISPVRLVLYLWMLIKLSRSWMNSLKLSAIKRIAQNIAIMFWNAIYSWSFYVSFCNAIWVNAVINSDVVSNRDGDRSVRPKRIRPSKCFKRLANRNSWTWSRVSFGCAGQPPPENSISQPPSEWDNRKSFTAAVAVVPTAVAIQHPCSIQLPVGAAARAVPAALLVTVVRMATPVDCISASARCRSASTIRMYWSPARRWNYWLLVSKSAVPRNWLRSILCHLLKVIFFSSFFRIFILCYAVENDWVILI